MKSSFRFITIGRVMKEIMNRDDSKATHILIFIAHVLKSTFDSASIKDKHHMSFKEGYFSNKTKLT